MDITTAAVSEVTLSACSSSASTSICDRGNRFGVEHDCFRALRGSSGLARPRMGRHENGDKRVESRPIRRRAPGFPGVLFGSTERRRSRTYPAWGYQTSPVSKVCPCRCSHVAERGYGPAPSFKCREVRSGRYEIRYHIPQGESRGLLSTHSTRPRGRRLSTSRSTKVQARVSRTLPGVCAYSGSARPASLISSDVPPDP
jgi:hypothetical protein